MTNQSPPSKRKERNTNISRDNRTHAESNNDTPAPDAIRLAELLRDLILKRQPKARCQRANMREWAGHIEKLIQIDDRTPDEIEAVIRWSQQDSFWQGNILSTEKLRKQIDTLVLHYASSDG